MIDVFGKSQTGKTRSVNEDSIFVDEESNVFLVADGMGGQSAGEVASRLAVSVIASFLSYSGGNEEITWPFGIDTESSLNSNRLSTAVKLANRRVWKQADDSEQYLGMGSTIVATIVDGDSMAIANAGDSRAYLVRDGAIEQLTEDDSWVQVAVSQGLLSPEEAEEHPMRNVITKAIGAAEAIEPQLVEIALQDGDICVMVSDGVLKGVPDELMLQIVNEAAGDLQAATERLISTAADNGSDDDISAVVLRYRAG